METDEWYNKASGFHSTCTCAKSEQVLREEIHQDSNNAHHCQCQTSDLNMLAMNPADKCLPIACTESVPGDRKADTSNVETILTHQLQSPSGVSKEADDQLLMGRWFALPSKNDDVDVMQGSVDMAVRHVLLRSHLDQTGLMNEPGSVNQRCEIFAFKGNSSVMTALTLNAAGFISDNRHCLDPHNAAFLNLMDVKPVLSTSATDMLHGNGQRGDIYIPSQGVVPPSISPSIPSVVSKPTNTGQGTNIPLSNLSPQCSQPQYYQQQQQQPQLVTTVMAPQFGVMEEAVFDQIQDAGGQILEEQTMRILNELQPGQFCSKEDFEYGQFIPSDPHSSTDLTPVIGVTFKTEANALNTSPVQVLPMNVSPFITSSSVTAASFKSADARGKRECGENVIKKDIPTNQSIGVSSNVTDSVYENQKVSIFTLNDPHVSMPLFGSDSEPNLSKDVSESQSIKMPLSMTSNMAEVAVTSEEVNSNLVEESGECSSDDFEEIFMERNKRKRRSSHLTLLSPKRVRGQGSSKGVVNTKGASVRGLPAVKPDFMKGLAYHAKVAKAAHSQNVCMDKSDTDSDEEWTPDVERKKKSNGEEVLVGYGDEYARELSLIRDKNLLFRPKYVNGEEIYECVFCKTAFTTEVDCVGHLRRMHAGNKLASTDLQVLDQWLQENDNKSLKKYSKPVNHTTFNTMLNRISNVKHSKSDISQSVCDNQLTNAIIQKRNIENTDEMKYNVEVCAYSSDNSSQMKANMRKPTEKKIYKCEVCGKEFNMSCNLKMHMKIHTGERHKCEVCGKEFTQLGSLKIHMSIHTGEGLYTCEVCGYSCNQRVLLKKHMQKHTVERLFKCEVCVYACWRNVDLKKHMRIHTGERLYKSEVCGNACKSTNNLKKHTRIHTGDKLYKCEMCGYSCNLKGDLKKHMMIHTGERLYKCEVCGKAFTQSGNLKTHMRIHTGERLYKCEVCGKSFYTKGNFKTHMIIHTGEGQFTCEVCGYSCNQRVNLKTHIMIHTGETPYKCEVCGKAFRQSSALRRHMRIHTGERDYKCELCGYACSRGYTLKQHMRVHTGERLYKCELCGYACSRGSILKQHMQIHTGVTVDM